MLEDVISGLPKALEISPIRTDGPHIQARRIQIKEKLARLEERFESSTEPMSISLSVEQKAEQYDILMALIRDKFTNPILYKNNYTSLP